jgi:hypothetical protein
MRRITAFAATAILATVLSASAYAGSREDDGDQGRWTEDDGGSSWQQAGRHGRDDGGRWEGRGSRHMMMHDDDEDEGGTQQRPTGGARFMLRAGDTQLAVRCGEGETMRSCVDAAIELMDRARAQPRPPAPPPPAGGASPNPSAPGGAGAGGTSQP